MISAMERVQASGARRVEQRTTSCSDDEVERIERGLLSGEVAVPQNRIVIGAWTAVVLWSRR
jgi:hypothetical protein